MEELVSLSRRYRVQVRTAGANNFQDSFVYATIPRKANGEIYWLRDCSGKFVFTEWFTDGDGITYEPPKSINIAWTQFEYSAIEVEVKICRRDGLSLGDANRVLA